MDAEKMNAVNKAVRKQLILSLVLSCMLVAGIPMIIFGASNKLWFLMAAGILFTVLGFYGTPMAWVSYGNKVGLRRVVYAVTREHLLAVEKISAQLGKPEKNIRALLDECFQKGYLPGYVRQGDTISLNEAKAPEETLHAAVCPYCGAKYTYRGTEEPVCPYCGAMSEKKGE